MVKELHEKMGTVSSAVKWMASILSGLLIGFIIGFTGWVSVGVSKAYSQEIVIKKIVERNCEKDKEWERYQQERVLNLYYWGQIAEKLGIPPPPQVERTK